MRQVEAVRAAYKLKQVSSDQMGDKERQLLKAKMAAFGFSGPILLRG